MSDESTIAASALLSSLLGAATANPSQATLLETATPQDGILSSDGGELLNTDGNSSTFQQLLQSNFDANSDSQNEADSPFRVAAGLETQGSSFELDTAPNQAYPIPDRFSPTDLSSRHNQHGNLLPSTGSSLPLETSEHLPAALADSTHTSTGFGLAGAAGPEPTRLAEQIALEASLTDDATTSTGSDLLQPESTVDALESLTPATTASTVVPPSDQINIRSRDPYSTGSSGIVGGSEVNPGADSTLASDSGLNQQDADGNNNPRNPDVPRNQQANTAEFALDTPQKGDFQLNATSLPGGEIGSPTLTSLSQITGSGVAVTSTPLTLVADRQLAGQQIAQHLAGFVRQGDNFVEINLSPPNLGKISARITLHNDQASVVLTTPSADIREIVEASLPRLGDLLEEAGLSLADANVSSQDQEQSAEQFADQRGDGETTKAAAEVAPAPERQALRGLLDAYA